MTKIYDWLVYFWGEWVSSVTPIPEDIIKYLNVISLILMMLTILMPLLIALIIFGITRSVGSRGGRYSG